jgi:hypothetical protein
MFKRLRYASLLCLMAGGFLPASSAWAQNSDYILTVVDVSQSPSNQVRDAVARVNDAFQTHPQVEYRDLHQLLSTGENEVAYGNVVSARQAFKRGIDAYVLGDYEDARQAFESASLFINTSFGFLTTATLYVDSLLYLAASQWHALDQGADGMDFDYDDVENNLIRLLVKFPDLVYARNRFDAGFNVLLDKIQQTVRSYRTGELFVDTETGLPGVVHVNGRYRGITPMTVIDLPRGVHLIRVVSQGNQVAQARAQVDPGLTSRVLVTLEPASKGDLLLNQVNGLRNDLSRDDEQALNIFELKGLLFTDYVVLVRGEESEMGVEVHAGLFSLLSGTRIRTARTMIGTQSGPRPAGVMADRLLEVEDISEITLVGEASLTEKWWFWASTAAVVTAGVITTVMLTRGEDAGPAYPKDGTGALLIRF